MPRFGWKLLYRPCAPGEALNWDSVLELSGGAIPDAVVAADTSGPPLLTGMERFPCLTVFYSVDSHIHSWHPVYAQGFDLCLVSLKKHLGAFTAGRFGPERVRWSPPYAPDHARPPSVMPDPLHDLLFVGSVRPELAPLRCSFLDAVRERWPSLHVTQGDFTRLFPLAKLVLNECSNNELNFRVFEAMGCGACLLTPDIGPDISELFVNGKELVLYPSRDAGALVDLARELLADDGRRKAIAAAGLAAIDRGHRAGDRAGALAAHLHSLEDSGRAAAMVAERKTCAPELFTNLLRPLYLHHAETIDFPPLRDHYLRAARRPGAGRGAGGHYSL